MIFSKQPTAASPKTARSSRCVRWSVAAAFVVAATRVPLPFLSVASPHVASHSLRSGRSPGARPGSASERSSRSTHTVAASEREAREGEVVARVRLGERSRAAERVDCPLEERESARVVTVLHQREPRVVERDAVGRRRGRRGLGRRRRLGRSSSGASSESRRDRRSSRRVGAVAGVERRAEERGHAEARERENDAPDGRSSSSPASPVRRTVAARCGCGAGRR